MLDEFFNNAAAFEVTHIENMKPQQQQQQQKKQAIDLSSKCSK